MEKLKKLLKLREITTPEEQKNCWFFDKILYSQISKLVTAKDKLDYHINCLKDDYCEKAMILCGQVDQQTGKPYARAYQKLIRSEESWKKQKEFQSNPYFQGLLLKQKRMQANWERWADECRILMDLYMASNPAFLEKWSKIEWKNW